MSRSFPRPFAAAVLLALALPAGAQHSGESQLNQRGPSSGSGGPTTPSKQPAKAPALLPPAFAGQVRDGALQIIPTPSDADAAHAAVLKENGLLEADTARYGSSIDGGYLVQVLRFSDATGAFAAFTFYRAPAMQPEALGQNAAAGPDLFLVQQKNVLVMARRIAGASHPDAERAALASLLAGMLTTNGPEGVLPTLPGLLPADGFEKQTLHYAVGPASYNGPLPPSVIPFDKDAEAATAAYRLRGGAQAVLTLIILPTPQIAGAALKGITALPDSALHTATRRIGPLIGVVSGAGVPQADAQRLVNEITYVSDVTLDQPQGYTSEVAKAAKLLLGIGYLTIALAVAALVLAVFFGAGRVLVRRLQGKPPSSVTDDEFITLKL